MHCCAREAIRSGWVGEGPPWPLEPTARGLRAAIDKATALMGAPALGWSVPGQRGVRPRSLRQCRRLRNRLEAAIWYTPAKNRWKLRTRQMRRKALANAPDAAKRGPSD